MKLSLFDLHCDTAYEMLRQKQPLQANTLAVSLSGASEFESYIQVMAHWTEQSLGDEEGWQAFEAILKNLQNDPAILSGKASIATSIPLLQKESATLLLSVEDARILCGKLERVDRLYASGIRILTPLWKGDTSIGGSHDTQNGLTEFGRSALTRAAKLGMILDISHASTQSAEEIFAIAKDLGRPVIASHSNAYEVCPVSRNLRRDQISKILQSGGIIGLNLHTPFLKEEGEVKASDLFLHIDYFLENGCEKSLALGCDMDGCRLPYDLPSIASLPHLAEEMLRHNYSEQLIQSIFYQNAYSFAQQYLA